MDALDTALTQTKGLIEQLITLATGVITLSITFTKDIATRQVRKGLASLKVAWTLYLFSILAGIWALMAVSGVAVTFAESLAVNITAVAGKLPGDEGALKIAEAREAAEAAKALQTPYVTAPAILQSLFFFAGTVAILAHGFRSFKIVPALPQSGANPP